MPVTTPDNIPYPDTSSPQNQPAYMGATAQGVQNALNARQRYTYVWANATARGAQTGMVQGSTGYQIDTRTDYIYDSGAWRLALSYAEYTSNQSVNGSTYYSPSTLSQVSSLTTDPNFTTAVVSGSATYISFAQPGIYSLAWTVSFNGVSGTVEGIGQFSPTTSTAVPYSINSTVVNNALRQTTVVMPFFRTTNSGQPIYLWYYHNSANGTSWNTTTTLRVGRLG